MGNTKIQSCFARYELKYALTQAQYEAMRRSIEPHMRPDAHPRYTISNLYYDTENFQLIRGSLDKPDYKEKLRLRSYGIPREDSKVFLEIKKKYNKVVNKRRISLGLQEAYRYLEEGVRPEKDSQILREMDFFLERYPLQKGLYLAYDRRALFGKEDPEFRLTFDTNIRCRWEKMELERGDYGHFLLPAGCRLMESKVMGSTPLWFSSLLSSLHIYPASFSKYGYFYKEKLAENPLEGIIRRIHSQQNEGGKAC